MSVSSHLYYLEKTKMEVKQTKKPYLQVKFEMNGFKQGDLVVSSQAAKGHQTPYKIDSFFCWGGVTEVHLTNNKNHWPLHRTLRSENP